MSRFNPTARVIHPQDEPDLLAGAVLGSLTRPLYSRLSWGVGATLIVSILSAGIAPVFSMTQWLRGIIAQHEQQFWHLSEWLRINGDPDGAELQSAAQNVRFNFPLAILSGLFACVAVGAVVTQWSIPGYRPRDFFHFALQIPRTRAAILFTASLSAAALCNWIHLAWHQQNVQRFLLYFNDLAERKGLSPIPLPKLELGLAPLWIVAALLLASTGAIWAIPVMLAAGAHRRYTLGTSVQTRSMLAERLRTVLSERRPPLSVPQPAVHVRLCVRPNCRSPLSWSANFCSRCGTKAVQVVDVVA
jgi:hypothetical protein